LLLIVTKLRNGLGVGERGGAVTAAAAAACAFRGPAAGWIRHPGAGPFAYDTCMYVPASSRLAALRCRRSGGSGRGWHSFSSSVSLSLYTVHRT
jgi:hypothetical protein